MVLKRRFFCAVILILSIAVPARAEARLTDCVRLHVVAADDGAAAQALKLSVRDACLDCARALLAGCESSDEAWDIVNARLPDLEAAAVERARAEGYGGTVRAETGVFDFPDRVYGDTLVPAGEYRALRVVIGAGQGHNWWCVLYPTLCMPEAEPGEPVHFYSSILRWLRGLFGGEAA